MIEKNNKIAVIIKLFADLTHYGPAKAEIYVPEGSNLNNIFEMYKIPKEKKMIILINSLPHYDRNYPLKEGDIIAIFPPLAGG